MKKHLKFHFVENVDEVLRIAVAPEKSPQITTNGTTKIVTKPVAKKRVPSKR